MIGTGDFRFRFSAENGISFSSAFWFTAENEKMHFRSASNPESSVEVPHQQSYLVIFFFDLLLSSNHHRLTG